MSTHAASAQAPALDQRYRLIRRARWLAWSSLAWMTIEGGVAVTAGLIASSPALIGFGFDSAIEGLASVIIIWRFAEHRALSEEAEERAQRLVAISFFILAPYVAYEALTTLLGGHHPDSTLLGIILSATSLVLMPYFGIAKRRVGAELRSSATSGEGAQNILCACLAAGVLVGLLANSLFGLWWLDPVVALGIAALAIREGREAWEGESC